MKRFFLVALAVIGTAAVSSAATLTITPDQASYMVGETITLTVTGDSEGAAANGVFGALVLSGSGGATGTGATQSQITSFSGGLSWTLGAPGGLQNVAFDQLAGTSAFPGEWASPLSTLTFSADSVGTVNFDWNTDMAGGFNLNFFGLMDNSGGMAPGASVSIVAVPEPTTAALMGLGLLGLAMAGRRR